MDARTPPNDSNAERAVLGSILLDGGAYFEAVDVLKPEDFYVPAHGMVLSAMTALAAANKAVDTVTLSAQLRSAGQLEAVGGILALTSLATCVPSAGNVRHYAELVRAAALRRQMIAVGGEIVRGAYEASSAGEAIDAAEKAVFEIAHGSSQALKPSGARELVTAAYALIEERANDPRAVTGVSTGIYDLDDMTSGLQRSDLIIIAGRPSSGKTSLGVGIVQHAAIEHRVPSAIFSLEMAKPQLTVRMISSEGRIESTKLRTGFLREDDWPRIARAASLLSEAPYVIDDTAAVTVMQVRAVCRRLAARHEGLGLVLVDYLQLMKGDGDSREQEISGISRGLKAIAKELNVPVIALSQLNRSLEQRKDKRPMLSDLRECIAAGEVVPDALTGALVPIESLRAGHVVCGLDERLGAVASPVADAWSTGTRATFRVRTRTGRTLRCTDNHPLLTIDGWQPVANVAVGTKVALARRLPEPSAPSNPYTDDELRIMGYLVCDGSYTQHRSVGYVKGDHELVRHVGDLVARRFGVPVKNKPTAGRALQVEFRMDTTGPNRNPLIQWLKGIGMHGQRGEHKTLPADVFESDNAKIGVLLGTIWAGDGTVNEKRMKFNSTSRALIEQVGVMLQRLGIVYSVIGPFRNTKSKLDLWEILISDRQEMFPRFHRLAPMPGEKGRRLAAVVAGLSGRDNIQIGRLPREVTARVDACRRAAGVSHAGLGYRCQKKKIARADLERVATKLGAEDLLRLASPDVLWDEVVSIEPAGEAECFDLRAPATGNFVASGFCVHNSGAIEQDADVIMFVYRDEVYDPETKDKGIAELIIGKQRNGSIGTVKARFFHEFTRFESLAERGHE